MENNIISEDNVDVNETQSTEIKTFTEAEVEKLIFEERKNIQSQIDSRVAQALNTREAKYKEEKMTIEEQVEQLTAELNSMRSNYKISNNTNEVVKQFNEHGIPLDLSEPIIKTLVDEDLDTTMVKVGSFLQVIQGLKNSYEEEYKKKLVNIPSPKNSTSKTNLTKTEFDKMDISKKIEFAYKYPDVADEFMKK